MFQTGAKIYLSEKNILGLWALEQVLPVGALIDSPGIHKKFCYLH